MYRWSGDVPYWEADASPNKRSRWTPQEIIGLIDAYPDYYVDMGIRANAPAGDRFHREVGRVINEVQALGRLREVDTSHLMVYFRNDVYTKVPKGNFVCTICDAPGRCSDLCTWEGAMKDAPFDTSWIMTIPVGEHRWAVDHVWGGDRSKDPWDPAGGRLWPPNIDREAIAAVNTGTHVAALYGPVNDVDKSLLGRDIAMQVSGVLMDLRNPAYRAWSVKKLIADLDAKGIQPGEAGVVQYVYKPGWHTYYSGSNRADRCFVEGSHMWAGPAGPCLGVKPRGGPFTRTPYGAGEFESAVNAMLREMRAGLVAAGLENVLIMTVERPDFMGEKWSIIDPSIQNAPWLVGDLVSSCDRTRLSEPPNPRTCRSRGSAAAPPRSQ